MTRPTTPTIPPAATWLATEAAELELVEGVEDAAAPLTAELADEAALPALAAREGPDPFEGLAMAEVADEGP